MNNYNDEALHINNVFSAMEARSKQLHSRPSVNGLTEDEAVAKCQKLGFPYQVYYNVDAYYSDRQQGVLNMLIEDNIVTTAGYMT